MPKKKKKPAREPQPAPAPPQAAAAVRPARDISGAVCAGILAAGFFAVALAVDSGADSSFDAPKRLVAVLFIAAAALAAFGFSPWSSPFRTEGGKASAAARIALGCVLFSLAAALLSAAVSPRRPLALNSARLVAINTLLLAIGASRVAARRKALLLGAFVAAAAINAGVSFLQARNLWQPFPLMTRGDREATGAFAGNPGYLAFVLVLAGVACLGALLLQPRRIFAAAGALGTAICLVGLLVNRNLTSFSAFVAGAAVLLLARFGRRAAVPLGALVLLAGAIVLAYAPMRQRAAEAWGAVRQGDWDHVVTYRLGAWAAAVEMARDRPWTGFGPGTYGEEFVAHRLRAEVAARRRMVNPLATSSYAEAHCDYLQPFAEIGVPGGLALLAAVFFLFRGLVSVLRRLPAGPARAEVIGLLALLTAAAVGALTWFPLQRPISTMPLLLLAGRAWRISAGTPAEAPEEPAA
jgi:O-antigen ligase